MTTSQQEGMTMMSTQSYGRVLRGTYVCRALAFLITLVIGLLFAKHAYAVLPANDNFADRWTIGPALPVTVNDTTQGSSVESGEPSHPTYGSGQHSVWYGWTAPSSGRVRLDTCGSEHFTLGSVYTGTSLNNLSLVEDTGEAICKLQFQAVAGTSYKISLETFSYTGAIVLKLRQANPPANDNFAGAVAIGPNLPFVTGGNNIDATKELGEPGDPTSSVWYRWTAPGTGTATFDTCTSDFDTKLTVFNGSALGNLGQLAANDDTPGCGLIDRGSRVAVNVTAGTPYQIAVDSSLISEGTFTLRVSGELTPPPSTGTAPTPAPKKKCKRHRVRRHGKCVKKKRRHS